MMVMIAAVRAIQYNNKADYCTECQTFSLTVLPNYKFGTPE